MTGTPPRGPDARVAVTGLRVSFGGREVVAIDDLRVGPAEIVGLAGESGSGKSMTTLAILGLAGTVGASVRGSVTLDGRELTTLRQEQMRAIRGRRIAAIFQSPSTAFSPVHRVGTVMTRALRLHGATPAQATEQAAQALRQVLLRPELMCRYPSQLSGGQLQRVAIALALALRADVLLADEPTSALDVTVQAQIMELLRTSKETYHLAMVLITHDLRLAAMAADLIIVMYAGQVVEAAEVNAVLLRPQHPYTAALLDAAGGTAARPDGRLLSIAGAPPELTAVPGGCRFHPRCGYAMGVCAEQIPPLEDDGEGRRVACHLAPQDRGMLLSLSRRKVHEP